MKTWSAESAFVRAYTTCAVTWQAVTDFCTGMERITRPPKMGHDVDAPVEPPVPPLAEDRVAMMLGLVPDKRSPEERLWDAVRTNGESLKYRYEDETPNPTEPSLSDDELVGVRGLLQERYLDSAVPETAADSPAGVDTSLAEVPPAGHPGWSALAEAIVNHQPTPGGQRDLIGAINDVLKEHRFLATVGQCSCPCDSRETPPRFTHSTWREHVAPLIAEALAAQEK
jgi:hypothetical protein